MIKKNPDLQDDHRNRRRRDAEAGPAPRRSREGSSPRLCRVFTEDELNASPPSTIPMPAKSCSSDGPIVTRELIKSAKSGRTASPATCARRSARARRIARARRPIRRPPPGTDPAAPAAAPTRLRTERARPQPDSPATAGLFFWARRPNSQPVPLPGKTPWPHHDYDLFVIGGGSGGVRAARVAAALGKRVAHRRGIPLRRHLRHPRLRAEEALVYASQFPEHFADAAGYGWTVPRAEFDWPTLIANKDREIARLEDIYRTTSRRPAATTFHTRAVLVDAAHDPPRERRPHRHRRTDPDRHGRPAQPACGAARSRALHLLQRGVRPRTAAEGDHDRRRRLHRRRVRQHLSRPRRRNDAGLSRPRDPVALRQRSRRRPA